jgi:hypothetical protein
MNRALVVALPIALIPVVALIACGESRDRAPAAPSCATGVNCNTGPGVVSGGGGNDAGTTDAPATDGALEVGEAGVTVNAIVRPLTSFAGDLSVTGSFETTVAIRAPRMGGGADVEATMPLSADGTYTLTGVKPVVGGATWLQVWKAGIKRTLAAVSLPAATGTVFSLPLFPETLPAETWTNTGQTTTYPTNPATVVVHVFGPDGKRLPGVKAGAGAGTTTKGPFYDFGTDVGTASSTAANGTIVFLGITGVSSFPIDLSVGTKTYGTISVPVEPNVVHYLSVKLE